MTPYDIATKVAQRFLYGELHHFELANFFGLLDIPLWEESQYKNAFGDFKKRMEMDRYITNHLQKYPNYTIPQPNSVAAEFKTADIKTIQSNEKGWIKKGFDELIKYEKETIQLFEALLKQEAQPKDEKLTQKIEQYIKDVKKELQKIESVNNQLQQAEYDFDKFVKEYKKGDDNMQTYENERRRYENEMQRRRMEDEMQRRRSRNEMDDDDEEYPSMGFGYRHYPYSPFMPFLESEMNYPSREREREFEEERERERREREYFEDMEMQRRGRGGRGGRGGGRGRGR